MGNRKLNELVLRASRGELTSENLNEVVLAIADNEQRQDSAIKTATEKAAQAERGNRDIKENLYLLPAEADELSKAVRKKGVNILGGKNSNAYRDKDLRTRVYQDIYSEIKRQYGLIDPTGRKIGYKHLQRKNLGGALIVVENYVPPIAIANEIESINEIDF